MSRMSKPRATPAASETTSRYSKGLLYTRVCSHSSAAPKTTRSKPGNVEGGAAPPAQSQNQKGAGEREQMDEIMQISVECQSPLPWLRQECEKGQPSQGSDSQRVLPQHRCHRRSASGSRSPAAAGTASPTAWPYSVLSKCAMRNPAASSVSATSPRVKRWT